MIVKRFYDAKLAQASYLVGCGKTGEAIVIDPNRDLDQYVRAARSEGVRVTHVTETHIHADFVSGSRELAQSTGAALYLSDEGGADWSYRFAKAARATLVKEGSVIEVGNVRLEVVHTPGHTPEHIIFLVTDTAAADEPIAAVTGDFVFVGDVGRPDLLEKAASVAGTMETAARQLFQSLQLFKTRPDWLQVWPGHGAGSACGKGLSAIPHSTVGYERLFNWAFTIEDESEFVEKVLEGQPEPPRYFGTMKQVNRDGPSILGGFPEPPRMAPGEMGRLLTEKAIVLDTRPSADYAAGHIPGTLNIPLNKSFTTYAGSLLPYDRDIYLVTGTRGTHGRVAEAVKDLAMIGLDRVKGYFDPEALESAGKTATIGQVTAEEMESLPANTTILDVRNDSEWEGGHIPGAVHIPLGQLPDRAKELPRDRPMVVHCQAGARSAIAASLLEGLGFRDVRNLQGGYGEWSETIAAANRAGAPGS